MASQTGRRRSLSAVLALLAVAVLWPGPGLSADDLFDEIYRRGAPMEARLQSLSATFVETTTSTLLSAPLVTRGRVLAQRPSNVHLTYDTPDPRVVHIANGRMTVDWPARSLHESRDVQSSLQRAARLFMGKSPDELRKLFDISAVVAPDRKDSWQVTFVPRRRQLRDGLDRLHLWIDQRTLLLQGLRMDLPGGDTRRMDFSDVVINPAIGPDLFTRAPRR